MSQARCICTLAQVSDRKWVKPKDGYLEPDPNCLNCKGVDILGSPKERKAAVTYREEQTQYVNSRVTATPKPEDIGSAEGWYEHHAKHVSKLRKIAAASFPPTGPDCSHPELWKPEHWAWFFNDEPSRDIDPPCEPARRKAGLWSILFVLWCLFCFVTGLVIGMWSK